MTLEQTLLLNTPLNGTPTDNSTVKKTLEDFNIPPSIIDKSSSVPTELQNLPDELLRELHHIAFGGERASTRLKAIEILTKWVKPPKWATEGEDDKPKSLELVFKSPELKEKLIEGIKNLEA